jgi:transcriptional regulator with XRE-family HTH domain
MDGITLGKRIREQRKRMDLSQAKFAEMLDISNHYLSEIERGSKMPSIKTLVKIVNGVGVSADVLLRDEVEAGKPYVLNELNELTERMKHLSPPQLKLVSSVLDTLLENLESQE